jgi:hypothetical protein
MVTGFIWLRTESSGALLLTAVNECSGSIKGKELLDWLSILQLVNFLHYVKTFSF